MIKRILAGLTLLALPLIAVPVANAQSPTFGLFEGAKKQACAGANLSADTSGCTGKDAEAKGATLIQKTIQNIINVLTIIVGIAAVIIIIVNGLRFITANGDSNAINAARNGIIYALVGLVIVALAQFIVRFVIGRLL